MSAELTLENAFRAVQTAFRPYACVAELIQHGSKIRFDVLDPDRHVIFSVDEAPVSRIRDPNGLHSIVNDCRSRIECEGHYLAPWHGRPNA